MLPHDVRVTVVVTVGCTTTEADPVRPPAVAVTLVPPTLTAVNTPSGDTDAMPGESDCQVTPVAGPPLLSDTDNWLVSPTRNAVGPEIASVTVGGLGVLLGLLGVEGVLEEHAASSNVVRETDIAPARNPLIVASPDAPADRR